MFGCTKPTNEVTAVAQTPLCRYQLGLGIYNVQAAVEGMDGGKRSHLLSLCGQLLRLVLIPCHIKGEPYHWTRSTAISFAAELDGHVLGTLCAVTMALLTNRLDLCIQGLFGAGKSKSMAVLIEALLELGVTDSLKILFICKENSGTRSFADLLLWLDPPSGVLGRIGRLVGDQERNKSSYSHTKFDINPRERRQMLNKCQASLGLLNVSMRNSALVGWWWGCGRSLAKLEVPLLNFLPFCPVGHSMQSFWQHLFLLDAGFQFGCVGFSVFDFWQMHFSVATVLQ